MDVVRYDFDTISFDGSDNLTKTLMSILNSYPELATPKASVTSIEFQILEEKKGIGMFPSPSTAILQENESVTGHVRQICAYAFTVVYRTQNSSTSNKQKVKEWLDNLGRWIEKIKYPKLEDGKEFISIKRTTQGYLYGTNDEKSEDWAISLQATYRNEFDR